MGIGFRQLLIIVLVIGLIWFYQRARRYAHTAKRRRRSPERYQDTVRCRYCGVYLPRSDARGDPEHGFACTDPACLAHRRGSSGPAT